MARAEIRLWYPSTFQIIEKYTPVTIEEPVEPIIEKAALENFDKGLSDYGRSLLSGSRDYGTNLAEVGPASFISGAILGGLTPHSLTRADEAGQLGRALNRDIQNTPVDEAARSLDALKRETPEPGQWDFMVEQVQPEQQLSLPSVKPQTVGTYQPSEAGDPGLWGLPQAVATQPVTDNVTAVPVAEPQSVMPAPQEPVSSTDNIIAALITQAEVSTTDSETKQSLVALNKAYQKAQRDGDELSLEMAGQALEDLLYQKKLNAPARKALLKAVEAFGMEGSEDSGMATLPDMAVKPEAEIPQQKPNIKMPDDYVPQVRDMPEEAPSFKGLPSNAILQAGREQFNQLTSKGFPAADGTEVFFAPSQGESTEQYFRHLTHGNAEGAPLNPHRVQALWLAERTLSQPNAVVAQPDGRKNFMGLYRDEKNTLHQLIVGTEQSGRVVAITSFVARDSKRNKNKALNTFASRMKQSAEDQIVLLEGVRAGHPGTPTDQSGSLEGVPLPRSGNQTIAQSPKGSKGMEAEVPAPKPLTGRQRLEAQPLPQLTPEQKTRQIAKLKAAKPIEIRGDEIAVGETLKDTRKNALKAGLALRGQYKNADTGRTVDVVRASITEPLTHGTMDEVHIQSIAAIPQIIENGVYLGNLPNEDLQKNPKVQQYEYFIAGMNVNGVPHTVKAVWAKDKDGSRYYDHRLTQIEKGDLLSSLHLLKKQGAESGSPFSKINDKRLLQILQEQPPQADLEGIDFSMELGATAAPQAKQVGVGDFGPIWSGYKNDPKGAIELLMSKKSGEVADGGYHSDVGYFALVYGKPGDAAKKYRGGYGLSHIEAKHGKEALAAVPSIIREGTASSDSEGYVLIESDQGRLVLAETRMGKQKTWLVTSYLPNAKKEPRPTKSGWTGRQVGESKSSPSEGLSDRTITPPLSESNSSDLDFSMTADFRQPSQNLWKDAHKVSKKAKGRQARAQSAEELLSSLGLETLDEEGNTLPTPDLARMIRSGELYVDTSKSDVQAKAQPQKALVRLRDVEAALQKISPLRTGSRLGRQVLGYYTPSIDVARTRHAGDLKTALHEIGHALDHKLNLRERSGSNVPKVIDELGRLGKTSSPADKLTDTTYLRNEGIAEFFRLYAVTPQAARKAAPLYAQEFELALAEDTKETTQLRGLVNDVTTAVQGYYGQDEINRLRANIVSRGDKSKVSVTDQLDRVAEDFRLHFDDSLRPLQRVQDMILDQVKEFQPEILVQGKYLPDRLAPYHKARTAPGYQGKANRHIVALKASLTGIGAEKYAQVVDYLTSAAALDYWASGMTPAIGQTEAGAARIIRKASAETVEIVRKVKEAYDVAVDEMMVDETFL